VATGRGHGTVTVADGPGFRVTADVDDPATPVIRLAGELDLASVGTARAGIAPYLTDASGGVTFDLEKLSFMDSSGIALLVEVSNEAGPVTLVHVPPAVRRVLEVTGLLGHFGLDP
jgi:anti-sigma B factor antagonist